MAAGGTAASQGAVAILAAILTFLAAVPPVVAGGWEQAELDAGAAALGGGVFPFERSGSPSAAFAAARHVAKQGGPAFRGPAAALEAKAAAVAGDYGRAARVAKIAARLPLPTSDLELMQFGAQVWSCLELLGADGQRSPLLTAPAVECSNRLFASSPPRSASVKAYFGRALRLLAYAGWPPTIAGFAPEAMRSEAMALATKTVGDVVCDPDVSSCPLAPAVAAAIWMAGGDPEPGRAVVDKVLAGPPPGGRVTALLQIAAGDLALGQTAAPEELGLSDAVSAEVIARRAGSIAHASVREVVDPTRVAQARSRYAKAAAALAAEDCPRCAADLDARSAYLALLAGDTQRALDGFAQTRGRFVELGDEASAARLIFPQVAILLQAGKLSEARRSFESQAAPLLAAGHLGWGVRCGELLLLLAKREQLVGNFAAALEAVQISARVAEGLKLGALMRKIRDTRAMLLGSVGLHREAIVDLRAIYDDSPPGIDPAAWRNGVGWRLVAEHSMTSDFAGARKVLDALCGACEDGNVLMGARRFDDALALARKTGDHLLEAMALAATRRFAEAGPLIEAEMSTLLQRLAGPAPEPARDLPSIRSFGLDCRTDSGASLCQQQLRARAGQIATLAARANLFRQARDFVERADRHFPRSILASDEEPWEEPADRAVIHEGLGEPGLARQEYLHALAIVERTVPELMGRDVEQDLRERAGYLYRDYAAFLAREAAAGRGAPEEGLAILEDWRARRFLIKLLRADAAQQAPSGDLLLRREQAVLEAGIASLRRGVMHADVSGKGAAAAADQLAHLEGELARFAAAHPSLSASSFAQLDFKQALAALRERAGSRSESPTVFVSYFTTRDSSFAWVVDAARVTLRTLPALRDEIDAVAAKLLDAIQDDDPAWKGPAQSLYQKLITPIEDLLPEKGAGRLGIVPYGSLARIPFHALLRDGEPLARRHPVFYLPSLRSFLPLENLARRRSPAAAGKGVVALGFNGRNLVGAEDEARRIAGPRRSIVGRAATKRAFMAEAKRAAILHVAAHAEQDLLNPFASFVQLADGPLQIGDLAGTSSDVRLLVLSACDTGRAETAGDEEQTGLAWAALASGIPTVLVTGWPIDDGRTGAFMSAFYEELARRRDLAGALARTQGEWARRLPPRIWAAFSLLGADQ